MFVKNNKIVKKVYKHFTYILKDGYLEGEHEASAVCSFDSCDNDPAENDFWRYDECEPATPEEYIKYLFDENEAN